MIYVFNGWLFIRSGHLEGFYCVLLKFQISAVVHMISFCNFGMLFNVSIILMHYYYYYRFHCFSLLQLMLYARQRLLTLNEFCIVCDEPDVFLNAPMLKVNTLERAREISKRITHQ